MFRARRGLDAGIYDSWRASAEADGRTAGPLLAWATTDDGFCVVSRGFLSLRTANSRTRTGDAADGETAGDRAADGWHHLGWHQIERGSFTAEDRRLSWTTYGSGPEHVLLREPGNVPEVFRERVAASITLEQFVPLDDSGDSRRGVIVSGRRDLSLPDAPIVWHASLPSGVSWQTPGIEELAERAVNRLRAEYDPQA